MDTTRHLSEHIGRPARDVYDYACDPARLPEWAPGLGSSIARDGDRWVMESPMGRVLLDFAPRNDFGVLDHWVTVPSGRTFYNPMRVTADGDGAEIVFSLRRQPGMSDDDFDRDAAAVLADLASLKRIVEAR